MLAKLFFGRNTTADFLIGDANQLFKNKFGTVFDRVHNYGLTRLSHLEDIRADKCNGMSKGDPKVFTTNGLQNYRKRGASTGSWGGAAVTGLLIRGGGWAGNSRFSVSSRICTSSDGCV